MSELIFDTTPSMPTFDVFNQVMSVNVAGLEGLVGAIIGIFVIMLISFKYEDWAKTLAPTYFILNSLGILVNPIALIVSSIWFSISVWNNTGFRVSKIPNLATSVGNAVMSPINMTTKNAFREIKLAKELDNRKKAEALEKQIDVLGASNVNMNASESKLIMNRRNLLTRDKLKTQSDLMKKALEQQKLNEIANKPFQSLHKRKEDFTTKQNLLGEIKSQIFSIKTRIDTHKNQIIKLSNEREQLLARAKFNYTNKEKEITQGRINYLDKVILKNKRQAQALSLSLNKLMKRLKTIK